MDIDIDFQDTFNPLTIFDNAIQASMVKRDELVKHPCGVYFQKIPIDNVTGFAAIPYEEAEVLSYTKFDCLHISLLNSVKSKKELRRLIKKEPNWELLLDARIVSKLSQIHKHHSLLLQMQPHSVEELADVIAMIRPNKRQFLESYLLDRDNIRPKLYRQGNDDKSSFRRGHAIAYALNVVLQLHLIEQKLL